MIMRPIYDSSEEDPCLGILNREGLTCGTRHAANFPIFLDGSSSPDFSSSSSSCNSSLSSVTESNNPALAPLMDGQPASDLTWSNIVSRFCFPVGPIVGRSCVRFALSYSEMNTIQNYMHKKRFLFRNECGISIVAWNAHTFALCLLGYLSRRHTSLCCHALLVSVVCL